MTLIALLGFSAGALSALRWNVLVLLATIGVALPLVVFVGVARGEDSGSLAVDMLAAVTFIEMGYIVRLAARAFVDAAGAVMQPAIPAKGTDRLSVLRRTGRPT